jgi:hypothetical protein
LLVGLLVRRLFLSLIEKRRLPLIDRERAVNAA